MKAVLRIIGGMFWLAFSVVLVALLVMAVTSDWMKPFWYVVGWVLFALLGVAAVVAVAFMVFMSCVAAGYIFGYGFDDNGNWGTLDDGRPARRRRREH